MKTPKVLFETPNTVSKESLETIVKLIQEKHPDLNFSIPEEFKMDWFAAKGYCDIGGAGTFPKRIASLLRNSYNTRIDNIFLSRIGQIARGFSSDNQYLIDFTDKIDWDSGDFGDSGSCYWNSKSGAKKLMMENGFYATRFFDVGNQDRGIGRCWTRILNLEDTDCIIIFNGYGYQTDVIARALSAWLGFTYKKIELRNQGSSSELLWINNGSGYLLYPPQVDLKHITEYDFDICEDDYSRCISCCNCSTELDEDDCYSDDGGDIYCDGCYWEIYFNCEHCCKTYCRDDAVSIDDNQYCERCVSKYFTQCDFCSEFDNNSGVHYCKDTLKDVCSNCVDQMYSCDNCGDVYENGENIDDDNRCKDCELPKEEKEELNESQSS